VEKDPVTDIESILDGYERLSSLGEGTYGEVFRARRKGTREEFALKRIRMENETQGIPATTLREIATLRTLKHPNIVKLYDVICKGKKLVLVFELMTKDLRVYLDKIKSPLPADLTRSYMYQIMLALDYCHRHRVIHRDIKPQNLLIDTEGNIKLADFGLARAFTVPMRQYSHDIVTLWYRAPEILLGEEQYGLGVDIWSVGAVFAEMLTYKPIFPGDSEIGQLYKIFQVMGTPNEDMWPGVSSYPLWRSSFPSWATQEWRRVFPKLTEDELGLLEKMLVYAPEKRISAKSALEDRYFAPLDKTAY